MHVMSGQRYYNYTTYMRGYPGRYVSFCRSRRNFLCPQVSAGGYVSYNLYRGIYPFLGYSGTIPPRRM